MTTEAADEAEIARLRGLLDRDRTGLAQALEHVVTTCTNYDWALEGRGPYEWNDDQYRAEFGRALRQIRTIAQIALRSSGTLANAAFRPDQQPKEPPMTTDPRARGAVIATHPVDNVTLSYQELELDGHMRASATNPTTPVKLVRGTAGPVPNRAVVALAGPGDDVFGYLMRVRSDETAEVEVLTPPPEAYAAAREDTAQGSGDYVEVLQRQGWGNYVEVLHRPLESRIESFFTMSRDHYGILRSKGVPEATALEAALAFTSILLHPEIELTISAHG